MSGIKDPIYDFSNVTSITFDTTKDEVLRSREHPFGILFRSWQLSFNYGTGKIPEFYIDNSNVSFEIRIVNSNDRKKSISVDTIARSDMNVGDLKNIIANDKLYAIVKRDSTTIPQEIEDNGGNVINVTEQGSMIACPFNKVLFIRVNDDEKNINTEIDTDMFSIYRTANMNKYIIRVYADVNPAFTTDHPAVMTDTPQKLSLNVGMTLKKQVAKPIEPVVQYAPVSELVTAAKQLHNSILKHQRDVVFTSNRLSYPKDPETMRNTALMLVNFITTLTDINGSIYIVMSTYYDKLFDDIEFSKNYAKNFYNNAMRIIKSVCTSVRNINAPLTENVIRTDITIDDEVINGLIEGIDSIHTILINHVTNVLQEMKNVRIPSDHGISKNINTNRATYGIDNIIRHNKIFDYVTRPDVLLKDISTSGVYTTINESERKLSAKEIEDMYNELVEYLKYKIYTTDLLFVILDRSLKKVSTSAKKKEVSDKVDIKLADEFIGIQLHNANAAEGTSTYKGTTDAIRVSTPTPSATNAVIRIDTYKHKIFDTDSLIEYGGEHESIRGMAKSMNYLIADITTDEIVVLLRIIAQVLGGTIGDGHAETIKKIEMAVKSIRDMIASKDDRAFNVMMNLCKICYDQYTLDYVVAINDTHGAQPLNDNNADIIMRQLVPDVDIIGLIRSFTGIDGTLSDLLIRCCNVEYLPQMAGMKAKLGTCTYSNISQFLNTCVQIIKINYTFLCTCMRSMIAISHGYRIGTSEIISIDSIDKSISDLNSSVHSDAEIDRSVESDIYGQMSAEDRKTLMFTHYYYGLAMIRICENIDKYMHNVFGKVYDKKERVLHQYNYNDNDPANVEKYQNDIQEIVKKCNKYKADAFEYVRKDVSSIVYGLSIVPYIGSVSRDFAGLLPITSGIKLDIFSKIDSAIVFADKYRNVINNKDYSGAIDLVENRIDTDIELIKKYSVSVIERLNSKYSGANSKIHGNINSKVFINRCTLRGLYCIMECIYKNVIVTGHLTNDDFRDYYLKNEVEIKQAYMGTTIDLDNTKRLIDEILGQLDMVVNAMSSIEGVISDTQSMKFTSGVNQTIDCINNKSGSIMSMQDITDKILDLNKQYKILSQSSGSPYFFDDYANVIKIDVDLINHIYTEFTDRSLLNGKTAYNKDIKEYIMMKSRIEYYIETCRQIIRRLEPEEIHSIDNFSEINDELTRCIDDYKQMEDKNPDILEVYEKLQVIEWRLSQVYHTLLVYVEGNNKMLVADLTTDTVKRMMPNVEAIDLVRETRAFMIEANELLNRVPLEQLSFEEGHEYILLIMKLRNRLDKLITQINSSSDEKVIHDSLSEISGIKSKLIEIITKFRELGTHENNKLNGLTLPVILNSGLATDLKSPIDHSIIITGQNIAKMDPEFINAVNEIWVTVTLAHDCLTSHGQALDEFILLLKEFAAFVNNCINNNENNTIGLEHYAKLFEIIYSRCMGHDNMGIGDLVTDFTSMTMVSQSDILDEYNIVKTMLNEFDVHTKDIVDVYHAVQSDDRKLYKQTIQFLDDIIKKMMVIIKNSPNDLPIILDALKRTKNAIISCTSTIYKLKTKYVNAQLIPATVPANTVLPIIDAPSLTYTAKVYGDKVFDINNYYDTKYVTYVEPNKNLTTVLSNIDLRNQYDAYVIDDTNTIYSMLVVMNKGGLTNSDIVLLLKEYKNCPRGIAYGLNGPIVYFGKFVVYIGVNGKIIFTVDTMMTARLGKNADHAQLIKTASRKQENNSLGGIQIDGTIFYINQN